LPQGIARLVAESRIGKHAVAEMSQATVRLLQAAAGIVGGEAALAKELNIGETLMRAHPAAQAAAGFPAAAHGGPRARPHRRAARRSAVRRALGYAHYPELKSDSS
jgi:hypothetical protein